MRSITLPGMRMDPPQSPAPLYTAYAPPAESPIPLKFIPYYAWANRDLGEMRVWVRV